MKLCCALHQRRPFLHKAAACQAWKEKQTAAHFDSWPARTLAGSTVIRCSHLASISARDCGSRARMLPESLRHDTTTARCCRLLKLSKLVSTWLCTPRPMRRSRRPVVALKNLTAGGSCAQVLLNGQWGHTANMLQQGLGAYR